jgi:hypothetical protein
MKMFDLTGKVAIVTGGTHKNFLDNLFFSYFSTLKLYSNSRISVAAFCSCFGFRNFC